MKKHLALIVDDEVDICELLELTLNRMDILTISANDLKTAYHLLNENKFSICLTDLRLPDGNGIELVKKIKLQCPQVPVAMISAHGNMDTAIEALKAGAFDFVSKPMVLSELRNLVNSAIALAEQEIANFTEQKVVQPKTGLNSLSKTSELLGKSTKIQEVRKLISKLSKSQAPIHITGESGTGKELAAKLIHQASPRCNEPFIPINCGAIPTELMESEFFGHKKGSFTGATKDKIGLFQAAEGGTLFLDEIADLPIQMQVKLLRTLQEKSIRSIGDEHEKKINVRVISATHKHLKTLVQQEKFREDLFYRINVIELQMPNLRDRIEDIPLLTQHFLSQLIDKNITDSILNSSEITKTILDKQAIQALNNYQFSGNVRELENILERAITLCENGVITTQDLNLTKLEQTKSEEIKTIGELKSDSTQQENQSNGQLPNREKLVGALDSTKWNRKAAASILGISYRQLRYRLKKLGLE